MSRYIRDSQDTALFSLFKKDLPPINHEVINGLATSHLKFAKEKLDQIIRCAEEQFPEDLVFVGSQRCDPIEQYNVMTKVKGTNELVYDLALSRISMIKYSFTFKGEPMGPYYMGLVYCRNAGLTELNGKTFAIYPVLADHGFSIGQRDIFIPMPRGRATFYQTTHLVRENGVSTEIKFPWSILHNKAARPNRLTDEMTSNTIRLGHVYPTLIHYLLARYGFYETFKRFVNVDIRVFDEDNFVESDWSSKEYVVIRSTKGKPPSSKIPRELYRNAASRLIMVVRREEYTPLVSSFLAQTFYIIDHFPEEMNLEMIDDKWQWQVLMGYILWGDGQSQGKLVEQVVNHLNSLDGYIDPIARNDLLSEGVDVRTIYELFVYIMENMRRLLNERSGSVSSMYNKELMVLRYVLRDLNDRMFKMLFKLNVNNRKEHTKDSVDKILRDTFKPKEILKIAGGKNHSEVSSVSSPSDNKFFKITSVILRQADTASKGRGKESRPLDATMLLDASFAEVGGYNVLSKAVPVGNNRIAPYVQLDENGRVVRKEKYRAMIDDAQEKIKQ